MFILFFYTGPLETIVHEKTGFLVDQKASEFAKSMARLINEPELRKMAAKEVTLVLYMFKQSFRVLSEYENCSPSKLSLIALTSLLVMSLYNNFDILTIVIYFF